MAPGVQMQVPASVGSARHSLTMLFADLSESTRLAASMEAELYAEMLDAVRAAYQRIVPEHGGQVVRIQGDGLLAIFGYPEPGEDDGRRACEAALALQAAVSQQQVQTLDRGAVGLALHSGVHAGQVLVARGDDVRGRFELVGDPVNVVARLSDAARRGEVLASEQALGPAVHFFEAGEREWLTPRGRSEPMAVRRLRARADGASAATRYHARLQRGLVGFIGRQRELGQLLQAWQTAHEGSPQWVALIAPPGLGKTRLAEQFMAQLCPKSGVQVHRGYCESYPSAEPLQAILQMLRGHLGLQRETATANALLALEEGLESLDRDLLRHRGELARLLSLDAAQAGAMPDPTAVRQALVAVFSAMARQRPQLLFVDDWQWADASTRRVLEALLLAVRQDAERLAERRPRLLLLITCRSEGAEAELGAVNQCVRLEPFNAEEAASTVQGLLPGADPFLLSEIHRYGGGNPLFIEELCHAVTREPAGSQLRLPASGAWLDALIESRVARLPAAELRLVRAAAVIGIVVPIWLLEAVSGGADVGERWVTLAAEDLLFPGEVPGSLRFKHGITRDVIYATVGLHERRALHGRIAQALRQGGAAGAGEMVEALAYHYEAAGQLDQAAYYAEQAGDKALAASALDRAQTQYRAALAALDRQVSTPGTYQRWSTIAQRLGLVTVFDPSRDHLDVLQRAVVRAAAQEDIRTMAQAEYWLGYIHYALGDSAEAIHHSERALQAAERVGDGPLCVQVRATLGQAHGSAGDYLQALPLLGEAIDVKRRHRSGKRPAVGLSYSLACQGAALGDLGQFAQAHEAFAEALQAVAGSRHEVEASVLGWRSAVYLWQGRWAEAEADALAAQAIAERVRSLYIYAMDRALAAYARSQQRSGVDELDASVHATAQRALGEATGWLEVRDRQLNLSLNHGWLAELSRGQVGLQRRHAAAALQRLRQRDPLGAAMAYRALARAHQDEPARARHYLAQARQAGVVRRSAHEAAVTALLNAELAAQWAQPREAARCLDEAEHALARMQMHAFLLRAQALRTQLQA